jgi:hypothetical protein
VTTSGPDVATRGAPGPKLTPKVLLEGTRLTHKTDLAFALNDYEPFIGPRKYRYHAPLVSAEWGAFTPFPWGRGIIDYDDAERDLAMETYATWARLFELHRYYSWVVDRFHLSTQVWQRIHRGRDEDFGWLEDRLLPLGFHVVLCTRRTGTFEAARAERLLVSGNPAQYDDLGVFVREQDVLRELVVASRLPVLELDMSDGDIDGACAAITDWMTASGGLWAPGPDA